MHLNLLPLTLVVALGFSSAVTAQGDLNGAWMLSFNTPQGQRDATATFKVDGDKLTGTLEGPGGEISLTGTVKGETFTCTMEVQTQNGPLSIAMEGSISGDLLKGTFNFGQGSAEWTGKRKPPASD